jgi:hypothetical protein
MTLACATLVMLNQAACGDNPAQKVSHSKMDALLEYQRTVSGRLNSRILAMNTIGRHTEVLADISARAESLEQTIKDVEKDPNYTEPDRAAVVRTLQSESDALKALVAKG